MNTMDIDKLLNWEPKTGGKCFVKCRITDSGWQCGWIVWVKGDCVGLFFGRKSEMNSGRGVVHTSVSDISPIPRDLSCL